MKNHTRMQYLIEETEDNIRLLWATLSDEEVSHYWSSRPKFRNAIAAKYGLTHEQIEKQIRMIERETPVAQFA